jgi:mannitol-specific phosphotransferase system IIBC component
MSVCFVCRSIIKEREKWKEAKELTKKEKKAKNKKQEEEEEEEEKSDRNAKGERCVIVIVDPSFVPSFLHVSQCSECEREARRSKRRRRRRATRQLLPKEKEKNADR